MLVCISLSGIEPKKKLNLFIHYFHFIRYVVSVLWLATLRLDLTKSQGLLMRHWMAFLNQVFENLISNQVFFRVRFFFRIRFFYFYDFFLFLKSLYSILIYLVTFDSKAGVGATLSKTNNMLKQWVTREISHIYLG